MNIRKLNFLDIISLVEIILGAVRLEIQERDEFLLEKKGK
jgi:hypothetical protein